MDRRRDIGWRDLAGLARSLVIYYGPFWNVWRLRRFYARFLGPGDLVFDIGAHVGNRARAFAGLGARVVAVEPQALFHGFLVRTLPRAGITLERAAVGAEPGKISMQVSSRHPTVTTGAPGWVDRVRDDPGFRMVVWNEREDVPCVTLDQLIARHGEPTFCKVDVEGMEAEVLTGLSRPVARVAVEYIPAALDVAGACIDRLTGLGDYRFNIVSGEAACFAWSRWCGPAQARDGLRRAAEVRGFGDLYAFRADMVPLLDGEDHVE
jgi:FkbM family methyltransferase